MTSKLITATRVNLAQRAIDRVRASGQPKQVAQNTMQAVARACGLDVERDATTDLTAIKPVMRELVASGAITFHHVEGGTSYYNVQGVDPLVGNSARPVGQGQVRKDWRVREGTIHARVLELFARKPWTVNVERLEILKDALAKGKLWTENGFIEADTQSDAYKQQMAQASAYSAIVERFGGTCSFDVWGDNRGRLYFGGGYASPMMGKLARWVYSSGAMVCLDHRTSFAQNYSLLTGSYLGKFCGVGTADDCDFWQGALHAYGVDIKPHTHHRNACKGYGMVTFYGASHDTAISKADPELKKAIALGEITSEEADAIREALTQFGDTLRQFGERVRTWAKSFTDWGKFPQWETPSGFIAMKEYYHHKTVVWNSGENEGIYYPKSMTLILKTRKICEQPQHEADKSVLVATTANLLQSLDASVMALTALKFFEATGEILAPCHDSYTVRKENAQTLRDCVIEAMREVADCEQIKVIRRELELVPVKVLLGKMKPSKDCVNLDLRAMNPLDEE